ncbi:MAG: DUF3105 domain-containing protein [bacterium]|nr:DUF3105 domain-containing protein [bacterium]
MEEQLTKYEQKKLRKQEKEERRAKAKQRSSLSKWLVYLLLGALTVGVVVLVVLSRPKTPTTPDYSVSVPNEGAAHVDQGTQVSYNSNPPTSGNHWPTPLKEGLYDEEKPDEAIIHSLEHGRVWVSYNPRVSQDVVEQLKNVLKNQPLAILTPRSANASDIALAAWDRLDTFDVGDALDTQRIIDFVSRYKNTGPERVPAGSPGASSY